MPIEKRQLSISDVRDFLHLLNAIAKTSSPNVFFAAVELTGEELANNEELQSLPEYQEAYRNTRKLMMGGDDE